MRFLGINTPQIPVETTIGLTHVVQTELPGMYSTPQREVWMAAGSIDAVVGESPFFKLWAANDTFSSADPRVAAGVWILNWQGRPIGGDVYSDDAILVQVDLAPEADPGPNLAAGELIITAIGGTEFIGITPTEEIGAARSPRAQCNIDTVAVPLGTNIKWPIRSTVLAPRNIILAPIYVPAGRAFIMGNGLANSDFTYGVTYVEAEEAPILPVRGGAI